MEILVKSAETIVIITGALLFITLIWRHDVYHYEKRDAGRDSKDTPRTLRNAKNN